ncbi:PQQ-dependent catabolism-associated CXXCW motif protein [Sphingomonas zeicaulis]|uniref:rhodanese-like domain-containing protein n=1 Tax=Sphingomonas zeicaulis TaxID=1632740 RepID=UPI003D2300D2
MPGLRIIAAIMVAAAIPGGAVAQDGRFDAEGYRIAHYRGPVPSAPAGVPRIALPAAAMLRPDVDAVFIDVAPAEGGHRDARTGRWTLAQPRHGIDGAHWFPGAGVGGRLDPAIQRWFDRGVARLTRGRRDRMVVIFCLADCWMSWNAAKRLAASGYTNIWWLAEGSDGWSELGLKLVPATPER